MERKALLFVVAITGSRYAQSVLNVHWQLNSMLRQAAREAFWISLTAKAIDYPLPSKARHLQEAGYHNGAPSAPL
jgi:hypothetical protein